MATNSTVMVGAAIVTTGVAGIAVNATEVKSMTSNTKVVSTCTTDMPMVLDAEPCQKFLRETCGYMKNDGKVCSSLFLWTTTVNCGPRPPFLPMVNLTLL